MSIIRATGIQMIVVGMQFAQRELVKSLPAGILQIEGALKPLNISIVNLDTAYYFVDDKVWKEIVAELTPIFKKFPWQSDKADCDNRAEFMSGLCSMIYGLNTCGRVLCNVYDATTGRLKYLHYCNLIIDSNGKLYLFDADNGCMMQKITTNNCVMGNNKYSFISIRVG